MESNTMKNLFFSGLMVPEPLASDIALEKQLVKEMYGASHALKTIPHITIIPPFRMHHMRSEPLKELMYNVSKDFFPLNIELNGFGFFEQRVVYINVVYNENLKQLHLAFSAAFHKYFPEIKVNSDRFNPHVTIAHKDLDIESFLEARLFFSQRQFHAAFTCQNLTLFHHDGNQWSAS
jgi:2'-5' RNA ligase